MANLNCIKAVLAEKGIMSKWLAKTLQKDPATVSKWCNNHSQPDLYTLARIAEVLDVDIHRLIRKFDTSQGLILNDFFITI